MDIQEALTQLLEKLAGWIQAFIVMLPNLAVAVLVVIAFGIASRIVKRVVGAAMGHVSPHTSLNRLIATVAYVVALTVGLFVALGIVGLDKTVTSLLAGVGILGLALGFAFQDIASNFMSGILLLIRRPFQAGDIIETNGHLGSVAEVNLRTTVIRTFDGKVVFMPNRSVLGSPLVNQSATGHLRVDIPVGVSYGDDLEKASRVAVEAIEGLELRAQDRDVELFYESFGGSSIDLVVRFWVEYRRHADYLEARSRAIVRVKKAFDANGITIPFPIRTLDFGIVGGEKLEDVLPRALAAARR